MAYTVINKNNHGVELKVKDKDKHKTPPVEYVPRSQRHNLAYRDSVGACRGCHAMHALVAAQHTGFSVCTACGMRNEPIVEAHEQAVAEWRETQGHELSLSQEERPDHTGLESTRIGPVMDTTPNLKHKHREHKSLARLHEHVTKDHFLRLQKRGCEVLRQLVQYTSNRLLWNARTAHSITTECERIWAATVRTLRDQGTRMVRPALECCAILVHVASVYGNVVPVRLPVQVAVMNTDLMETCLSASDCVRDVERRLAVIRKQEKAVAAAVTPAKRQASETETETPLQKRRRLLEEAKEKAPTQAKGEAARVQTWRRVLVSAPKEGAGLAEAKAATALACLALGGGDANEVTHVIAVEKELRRGAVELELGTRYRQAGTGALEELVKQTVEKYRCTRQKCVSSEALGADLRFTLSNPSLVAAVKLREVSRELARKAQSVSGRFTQSRYRLALKKTKKKHKQSSSAAASAKDKGLSREELDRVYGANGFSFSTLNRTSRALEAMESTLSL